MSSKTISAIPLFSQSMSEGVNRASGASNRSLPNFITLPSKRFYIKLNDNTLYKLILPSNEINYSVFLYNEFRI